MNETAQPHGHVYKPSMMLDPDRFQYLWRLAEIIADSSTVPDTLKTTGTKNNKRDLPKETVVANCFLVCEQADRWKISPFALISCASIVHGKLGFEGKVIHAVLESVYGIELDYEWSGEGDKMEIIVSGPKPGSGEIKTISGSVKDWKTTGDGSPWQPKNYQKMLAYRGAREWARLWYPAAIMGIVSDDELSEIASEARFLGARDVPDVASRLAGPQGGGFDKNHIAGALTHPGEGPINTIGTLADQKEMAAVERSSDNPDAVRKAETQKPDTGEQSGRTAETTSPRSKSVDADGSPDKAAEQSAAEADEPQGGSADKASATDTQKSADRGALEKKAAGAPALSEMPCPVRFREAMRRSRDRGDWDKACADFKEEIDALPEKDREALRSLATTRMKELKKAGNWSEKSQESLV